MERMMQKPKISYKKVSEKNVESSLELMRSYYKEDGYAFSLVKARSAILKLISSSTLGKMEFILVHGQPVGYYCLSYGYSLQRHGRDAVIDEIYIDERARNKGIGQRTIRHIRIELKKEGFKGIYLFVRKRNVQAQRLYKRIGFKKIEEAAMFLDLSKLIGI
jgi:ribosomal protein S18 acetylase RimI-like enzyme